MLQRCQMTQIVAASQKIEHEPPAYKVVEVSVFFVALAGET